MLIKTSIIKRLPDGRYRLYSRKKDIKTKKRRNLGTYDSLSGAKKREQQISFFKHHSDDGATDDFQTKTLSRLSNIATYLEEAGYIDSASKIYAAMDAVDGDLTEDCVVDMFVNTDEQMNIGGGEGFVSGSPGQGAPSFGMDQATASKLVDIANILDKIGMHDYASKIDAILLKVSLDKDKMDKIIDKLEKNQEKKETEQTEGEEPKKQNEDVVARSTGHNGTAVTDNPSAMGQGLSDTYFYHGNGSVENNL
jgi:hypothetical protein